jgi:hypothetical protein
MSGAEIMVPKASAQGFDAFLQARIASIPLRGPDMAQTGKGNAEKVFGSAISVPLDMITGLADLLIAKDVISREEMVSLLQQLADRSPKHGENEDMVRMILEATLARYQKSPPPGSGH